MSIKDILDNLEIPRCSECKHHGTIICEAWSATAPESILLCPAGVDLILDVVAEDLNDWSRAIGNSNISPSIMRMYLKDIASIYKQHINAIQGKFHNKRKSCLVVNTSPDKILSI